jgi:hypothetical protein
LTTSAPHTDKHSAKLSKAPRSKTGRNANNTKNKRRNTMTKPNQVVLNFHDTPTKTIQRGKRASSNHVQVNGFIRKEYRSSLHYYAQEAKIGISDLIGRLLEEYVDKRGGIIGKNNAVNACDHEDAE